MKIDRITFMETFPTIAYGNQRLGAEATLEPGDDPVESYKRLRETVIKSFNEINPGLYIQNTVTGERTMAINPSIEAIIADIQNCKSISEKNSFGVETGLLSYQHLCGTERINQAYQKRLQELQNQ